MENKIKQIIEKYQRLFLELLREEQIRENRLMKLESFTSETKIVPHDFFSDADICGTKDKIPCKDFGKPIVIFTDLKKSTLLLEYFLSKNAECLYVAYIYYSSSVIAETLDLMKGKLVEITGDGTYALILENEIDEVKIRSMHHTFVDESFRKDRFCSGEEWHEYLAEFDSKEIDTIQNMPTDLDCILRHLFFLIMASFNIPINKELKRHSFTKPFLTRVGCKIDQCKIVHYKISGHISQQKLLGMAVHKASHQANGK